MKGYSADQVIDNENGTCRTETLKDLLQGIRMSLFLIMESNYYIQKEILN